MKNLLFFPAATLQTDVTFFIGEMPGGKEVEGKPAFDKGFSAMRLSKLMDCPDVEEFKRKYYRMNVFESIQEWDADEARVWAALFCSMANRPTTAILCGAKVHAAFGLVMRRPFEVVRRGYIQLVLMPHPSGLNRWWNDPANVELAKRELSKYRR